MDESAEERIYVDADEVQEMFPGIRAMALAHLLSLGTVIKEGEHIGFSMRLEQMDAESWDQVVAKYAQAKPLTDKIWVAMDVRREDLQAAWTMLATDPKFAMHPGKVSSLRYKGVF